MVVQAESQFGDSPGPSTKFCFWCMNPAIAINSIKDRCSSIILASGTLSPLSSFSAELNAPFPVRLEAPHVINKNSQVYVEAIAHFNQVGRTDCTVVNATMTVAIGLMLLMIHRCP